MGDNAEGVLAVIFVPIMLAAVIISVVLLLYKARVKKLDTLARIVELGGNADPEILKLIGEGMGNSHKVDYRKGLIWIAIGLPLTVTFYTSDGMEGAIIGMIPLFIGGALLLSGKLRLREP